MTVQEMNNTTYATEAEHQADIDDNRMAYDPLFRDAVKAKAQRSGLKPFQGERNRPALKSWPSNPGRFPATPSDSPDGSICDYGDGEQLLVTIANNPDGTFTFDPSDPVMSATALQSILKQKEEQS